MPQEFELFAPRFMADQEDVEKRGCHCQSEGHEAGQPVEEEHQAVELGTKNGLAGDGEQEGNAQEHQADDSSAPGRIG